MKPTRLHLAILISVILIGGALFRRVESVSNTAGGLVSVNNQQNGNTANQDSVDEASASSTVDLEGSSASATSTKNLSDADLISRQMFSDYLNLSLSGQNTSDNLNALGDTYANSLTSLDKSTSIELKDVQIVPDSHANFQAYSTSFNNIYTKYQSLLTNELKDNPVTVMGPQFLSVTANLGIIYDREAAELQAMSVPASLSNDHLALVNAYLDDAWAMQAISNESSDPMSAFAGMVAENKNLASEKSLVADIQKILAENGI